jgi:hypothetical protein
MCSSRPAGRDEHSNLKKSFRCAWPEQRGGHLKSLFLEELLHDAVRQFFFVPLALFAQECYTLAIKDSVLSAGFSEIRKSAYANRTD